MRRERTLACALAVGVSVCALAWDPSASAADSKRTLGLVGAICVLVACWAVRDGAQGPRGKPRLAILCALGLVAWSTLSLAWGARGGALDAATWVAAAAVGVAAYALGRGRAIEAARLAGVLVGGGASMWAIASWWLGARGLYVHAGQGNPNWLGLLLAVTLPLSIDAIDAIDATPATEATPGGERASRRLVPFPALATALHPIALYLSHARVAWVAATIAVIVVVLPRVRTAKTSALRLAGATLLVVVASLGACARTGRSDAAATRTHGGAGSDPYEAPAAKALAGRAWIWRVSADAALEAQPFGGGLGSFGHRFLRAQGEALVTSTPREASRRFVNATTAHNDWLQVAVESGVVGVVLFAGAFALGVVDHVRRRWFAGAAALVAVVVGALGDSPLRQPAVVFVVALVFGALGRREAGGSADRSTSNEVDASRGRPRWTGSNSSITTWLGVVAAAGLLLVAARTWIATRIRTGADDALPAARLVALQRSTWLDPWSGEAALDLGLAYLEAGANARAVGELQRSLPLLANVGTEIALGNAELGRGDVRAAVAAYRRALVLHPGAFRAHANLSEALRMRGALDDAETHARIALSLEPGNVKVRTLVDRIGETRASNPPGTSDGEP